MPIERTPKFPCEGGGAQMSLDHKKTAEAWIGDIQKYKAKAMIFENEEDVRSGTNAFLKSTLEIFGVEKRNIHSEVVSAYGGRADSIYSDVIIEYKRPQTDITKDAGQREAVYGRGAQDNGLKDYLVKFALEESPNDQAGFLAALLDKVGVGFNGRAFIFARFVPSKETYDIIDPNNPTKFKDFPKTIEKRQYVHLRLETELDLDAGMKRLLLYMRSTGRERMSSKTILKRFGPQSETCRHSVPMIYKKLEDAVADGNPKVVILYDEWNRIFGDVYGNKETDFTSARDALFGMYNIGNGSTDIRRTLFSVQTYYNIILKLLVNTLLNSLNHPAYTAAGKYDRVDVHSLFAGKTISDLRIPNFFEVHYFEWFLYCKDFNYSIIRDVATHLDQIEATASVIKPEIVEDVFREVYNGLMPKQVRRLLGEYYTPGWLVDFALDTAEYRGQADKSLLDPTCGSGSFLTHAIKRFVEKNKGMPREEMVETITTKIVGYDINPITVITAKANYILALGDVTTLKHDIDIPIYMCDSVLVPTVHAKQNSESNSIKVNTIVGEFEIPVFKTRKDSDAFMHEVSECVERYSFEEFISYAEKNKGLSMEGVDPNVAKEFYRKVCDLHLTSRDGFWGIILKDAFAPLFSKGGFDVIVGNPPWISWKAMSDTYRKQTLDIWLGYGIFEKSSYDKITTHDDFAMAVTYVSIDHYLKSGGELVFILPQTFLKASKGGEGFRKFSITRDRLNVPFAVEKVYDMLKIQPFRGIAANKASMVRFKKNKKMEYPIDEYMECVPNGNGAVCYSDTYDEAVAKFDCVRKQAKPINANDDRSPWLTMDSAEMQTQVKFLGQSAYRGRKGVEPCGAKGIYLVNAERDGSETNVRIANLLERSRLAKAKERGVKKGSVEKDFVYPMVGGRNFEKWGIKSHLYIMVPHYEIGKNPYHGVPETELKVNCPLTYKWLYHFHDILLETRIRNGKFFDKDQYPFYRLDNVGPYTFAPYKVAWREQNRTMVACVISTLETQPLGKKIVVTDSKVLFCPLNNRQEAHYLCAVINSPLIARIIDGYTIDTNRGIDILDNIKIPEYSKDNPLHRKLAVTSIKAHRAHAKKQDIEAIEKTLDALVMQLFE